MDKRWIAIFIILIIGVTCMYFVVDSSNTVGSAIADVNKSTITIPHGFSKGDSDTGSILLVNKQGSEKIFIKDLGKSDISKNSFEKKFKSISQEMNIIKNTTNVTNNVTVYSVYYQNGSEFNESISYFYSCQHTFYMKMSGFKDIADMENNINFIVNTIKPDYKQTQ